MSVTYIASGSGYEDQGGTTTTQPVGETTRGLILGFAISREAALKL
jgi:hypothetical protein